MCPITSSLGRQLCQHLSERGRNIMCKRSLPSLLTRVLKRGGGGGGGAAKSTGKRRKSWMLFNFFLIYEGNAP